MHFDKSILNLKLVVFDFDGVFTDNTVWTSETGEESVRCSRSDGLGLAKLKDAGIKCLIVSTEKNPVVSVRAKKLKIECIQGVEHKDITLKQYCLDQNIKLSDTMYVGNDINDLCALDIVGFPVCVADGYDEVKAVSKYITSKPGGFGAVREICDSIVTQMKSSL